MRNQDKGSMVYEKIRCQHAIAVHMSLRNIPLPSMKILYFLAYAHSLSTSCTPSTTTLQQLHTSINNRTRHFMPILNTTPCSRNATNPKLMTSRYLHPNRLFQLREHNCAGIPSYLIFNICNWIMEPGHWDAAHSASRLTTYRH